MSENDRSADEPLETSGSTPVPESVAAEGDATTPNAGSESTSPGDAISVDQAKLALRKVKDPELGLNIVDLGLIYEIVVDGSDIHVDMTLTSPGCPAGPQIMSDAERALQALPGVGEVELNLVWTPYWTPERIEPRVRAYMGL